MSEIILNKYKEQPSFIYAGFFTRLVAFIIDMLVISSVERILQSIIGFGVEETATISTASIIHWLLVLLYFTLFTYLSNGQTLGKMVMNIRVVSLDGNKLSLSQVVSRETFGRYVQNKFVILYIIIGFSPMKQSLMDMLCDTAVIKNKEFSYFVN
ncbi:RDD family protein [uncultured Anaerococcus sp.]|uniref:RDD family protein n=1 Tax=uncultured Anaerococcus sp. TaxID=293428 RepID=UPI00261AEC73|nr:RDD family protein [uncultured Anaerococcus sp.]